MSRVWKFLFSFVLFAAVCYGGLVWFIDSEVSKEIDQAVANTPGMELVYDDVTVSISDHSVKLDGVEAKLPDGQRFTAETLQISRIDQVNPVPHFLTAQASGVSMTVNFSNFGSWAAPLLAMGLKTVNGDVAFNYDYDAETKALKLNELDIKVTDIGDLNLSGTIASLNLEELRVEQMLGLRVASADLKYTDRSLINSMMRGAANAMGTTDGKARATICAELAAMADYAGKDDNVVAENALRGIKRFVDNPGNLTISVKPAEPVPFLFLFMGRDFYDNLRLLNVKVSTDSSDDI